METTVKEFISEHKYENKPFYLIPNIVSNQTFREPYWKSGFETTLIVPKELSDKKVIKSWHEDGMIVMIWKNE